MLVANFNRNIVAAAQDTANKGFFIAVEEEGNITVYTPDETPLFHVEVSDFDSIYTATLHPYSQRNHARKMQPIESIFAHNEESLGYAINQMVKKELDKAKPSNASLPVSSWASTDQQPVAQPV